MKKGNRRIDCLLSGDEVKLHIRESRKDCNISGGCSLFCC